METKVNLNTIILLLILLVFVVGTIVALVSIRRLTQPLEEAEQAFERKLDQLTNPNPTPTIIPDPVTIIHEVRSLSRLETASYTVEKVITAESGQGSFSFLFGDRLILVAHGQVIAGVDLGKMDEDDIAVEEDGSVTITLPPAEVLVVTLNNQKSYIFNRDTGLVGMNPALETEARVAAEQEILNAALEDGILEIAQQNAEVYVLKLLLALGFRDISFAEVSAPTPTPMP
jgi:hypothetical protein